MLEKISKHQAFLGVNVNTSKVSDKVHLTRKYNVQPAALNLEKKFKSVGDKQEETKKVILKKKEKVPVVSTVLSNEIPRLIHVFNETATESYLEPNKSLRVNFVVNENLNETIYFFIIKGSSRVLPSSSICRELSHASSKLLVYTILNVSKLCSPLYGKNSKSSSSASLLLNTSSSTSSSIRVASRKSIKCQPKVRNFPHLFEPFQKHFV